MKHAFLWWRINDWISKTMQVTLHSIGIYGFSFNMDCASFTSLKWITIALSLLFLILVLRFRLDCKMTANVTISLLLQTPFGIVHVPQCKNFSFVGSIMSNISSIYSLNKFCPILDVFFKKMNLWCLSSRMYNLDALFSLESG